MKSTILLIAILLETAFLTAQPPILYVHIVSHNEPSDNLDASAMNYNRAKANALQMADIIDSKNAKWNLQTSDGFVVGALQFDSAGTSPNDIFEILSNPPYDDNIEIDPRSKNKSGRNIADQWYLLDSCGANPTTHLGGCIYTTTNPSIQPIDWLQYRNPVIGNIYGNSWQCSIITGAGSYPPHSNDLNDFGVFKPDTTTDFYHHNPAKNLWCMGTGCAPVLDSLDDEQAIIDLIRGQVDSIQNGLWPPDKFYVTRIMTNQREYGPLFFQKISRVIDSLNLIPGSRFKWATVSEVFTAFQDWQLSSTLDHSQWLCGETISSIPENTKNENFSFYPNPVNDILSLNFNDSRIHFMEINDMTGRTILRKSVQFNLQLDLTGLKTGFYLLNVDSSVNKLLKN